MTRIAITGYASLDHVAMLDGSPQAGRTTTILNRPTDAWPRLGGSPAYVAAALVGGGVAAFPVSWVGTDDAGRNYRRQLAERGISVDGIVVVENARTPVAVLAYEPSGGCICLYHPGMPAGLDLSETQRRLIGGADWLCVTIGPPAATEAALGAIPSSARLAWVVKHDPRAITRELAAALARRADLICCSQAEAGFLGTALKAANRSSQLVIETRGRAGASFRRGSETGWVPADPLATEDPTGAGDSFAGGALAAMALGEGDPAAIVQAGHRAARALLAARVNSNVSECLT